MTLGLIWPKGEHDMMPNEMTVNVKIKRIELCDLLLACTAVYEETGAEKWSQLHDKLNTILEQFDEKHEICVFKQ